VLEIDTPDGRPPELHAPVLVAAFGGWNDAGEAATGAVEHLQRVWDAEPFARVDPEDYYDYQVHRPTVRIDETGTRQLDWPTSTLSVATPRPASGSGRDVVLLRAIEPSMRWQAFAREVLDLAERLEVELVVTLGALLADVAHTRPVQVTGTCNDPELAKGLGLQPSRYQGPTGIVGVLHHAVEQRGLPGLSYWAAVPHYVSQTPCPKATVALLRRLEDLLDLAVPLGDLPEQARAWERGVAELAAEDEDVAEYVRTLEAEQEATELPEASGDAIAKEFERYLRRNEHGDR
jgi:predicted ATP-grasp superfamily ATP-dependent carboligase